jgi:hypothetical protein
MADRIPLVISDNKLREIASADNLKVGKVVPVSDGTYDLGDSSAKFNKIWVGAQGLYTGSLYLKDSGGTLAAFNVADDTAASIAGGVSGLTWTSGSNSLSAQSADGSSTSVTIGEHSTLNVTSTLDVAGLASLDGGIDVDGAFTVADTSGNINTTGTANIGSTLDVAGLASLDGGIDVDGAFTVADGTGNVSTSGTLAAGNTTISGTLSAGAITGTSTITTSGLATFNGGIAVDGSAFTVADATGNVSTTGTLAAGNTTITGTLGAGNTTITGTLDVTSNVVIGGNLQVSGTTTTVAAENLEVSDNMIYLNAGESSGSPTLSIDIGWAGNYNEGGSYAHAGLFRDATDQRFKIYDGYTLEPDAGVEINTGHASFNLADFQAATFIGALSGNATTASAWETARNITLSGDVSGSTTGVDGSGNITISNMAIGAGTVSSTELTSASTLLIKNAAGTTVKTIIGAGS